MSIVRDILNGFLKVFGDIKVFRWPLFIIYDPGSYLVKGYDMRQVIKIARPGDILLRGYNNYLDGYFIPGYFSHAGLYVGNINPDDAVNVTTDEGKKLFRIGEQMVIHSMAEGVFMQDLLDFCRCDRMMIIRFPDEISAQKEILEKDVPFNAFNPGEKDLFRKLLAGEKIPFTEALKVILPVALSQIGKKYDFSFDFKNYNNLSCTEFVYYCIKSLESFHGLKPMKKKFFLYNRTLLLPDDFLKVKFIPVWQSSSINEKRIAKIKLD
jgi:hypothetical protein